MDLLQHNGVRPCRFHHPVRSPSFWCPSSTSDRWRIPHRCPPSHGSLQKSLRPHDHRPGRVHELSRRNGQSKPGEIDIDDIGLIREGRYVVVNSSETNTRGGVGNSPACFRGGVRRMIQSLETLTRALSNKRKCGLREDTLMS